MQKLILGADHAGFELKEQIKKDLLKHGIKIEDITPTFISDDDYPPIARAVVQKLYARGAPRFTWQAILICGSGYGMDITANRFKGIRAIVARSVQDAIISREEDHSNILILGGRITKPSLAKKIISAWLEAKSSQDERHVRRVKKIDED